MSFFVFFFFQAEDGIRDKLVTGVQTCALPISGSTSFFRFSRHMCLLNLKKLVEPVKTMQPYEYPLHLRACDETHAQGGYVSWAHFPSWPGVESQIGRAHV